MDQTARSSRSCLRAAPTRTVPQDRPAPNRPQKPERGLSGLRCLFEARSRCYERCPDVGNDTGPIGLVVVGGCPSRADGGRGSPTARVSVSGRLWTGEPRQATQGLVSVGNESLGSTPSVRAKMNRSSKRQGGVQRDFDAREDRELGARKKAHPMDGPSCLGPTQCLDRVPSGSQMWWTDTTSHTTGAGVPIWPSSLRCAAASGLCRMASNASWLSHCA